MNWHRLAKYESAPIVKKKILDKLERLRVEMNRGMTVELMRDWNRKWQDVRSLVELYPDENITSDDTSYEASKIPWWGIQNGLLDSKNEMFATDILLSENA